MLVNLVVGLIVLGVLLWLVNNLLPMDEKIKKLLNIVAVVGAVLWVLHAFGILLPSGPMMTLILGLVVLGVVLWAVNTYIPMDGRIKTVVNVVILLVCLLSVLQSFGYLPRGHYLN